VPEGAKRYLTDDLGESQDYRAVLGFGLSVQLPACTHSLQYVSTTSARVTRCPVQRVGVLARVGSWNLSGQVAMPSRGLSPSAINAEI